LASLPPFPFRSLLLLLLLVALSSGLRWDVDGGHWLAVGQVVRAAVAVVRRATAAAPLGTQGENEERRKDDRKGKR
jgi:hypothetical protein